MGVSSSQQPNYDFEKAWKDVKNHIDKGLPKSALEKVEEINEEAQKRNIATQIIKSFIYLSRLTVITEEEGIEIAIQRLELTINKQEPPVNHVLAAYLADLYSNYFNNYRWEISQRTEMTDSKSSDFRTWTPQQFITTIEKWYIFALENGENLNFSVNDYKDILEDFDTDGAEAKPTLYEMVADKAIQFFQNASYQKVQNIESFKIDDEKYFSPAASYSSLEFGSKNQYSAQRSILEIYQKLLTKQFRSKSRTSEAYYDLARLKYIHTNAIIENKDSLYQEALVLLADKSIDISYYSEIISELVQLTLNNTDNELRNVEAIKLCEKAIQLHPNSIGAGKCRNIIQNIKAPQLEVILEKVYPSKQHIVWALDFKNVEFLNYYFVKLDGTFDELTREYDKSKIENYLSRLPKVSQGQKSLELSDKYQMKRAEFIDAPIKYGRYAMVITDKDKEIFKYVVFHISDLAWTTYHLDGHRHFNITDRTSGKPIPDVDVIMVENVYNRSSRSSQWVKNQSKKSDKFGRVSLGFSEYKNYKIIVAKGQDILDINSSYWSQPKYPTNTQQMAEIYTDRSIYRPGQVVHFKAILLEIDENNIPSLVKNKDCDIVLKDANYQEVTKLSLKSNNFGSVQGSFVLPNNKLTGIFAIEVRGDDNLSGYSSFNIEEYKRPTFEVTTSPVKEAFKLGDYILLKGQAKTLAGSIVDGAEVAYKVVRTARFPYWGLWWRRPEMGSDFIIGQGTTKTDKLGEFEITFEALPDKKLLPADNPIFNYRIEIDVTDQKGETRSHQTSVSVGYQMLEISLDVPSQYDKKDNKGWVISTKNLQGVSIDVDGAVKVLKLKEPKNVIIKKYWDGKVDFPISLGDLNKHLPNYPQFDKNTIDLWEVEGEVSQIKWKSGDVLNFNLEAGVYKIIASTQDSMGQKVVLEKYTVVSDIFSGKLTKDKFLHTYIPKIKLEPGETFTMKMSNTNTPVYAQVLIENGQKIILDKVFKVTKAANISIPIEEYMRGGASVTVSYIIHNRVFTEKHRISVPWTNKQLSVKFESFRDKSMPGAEEEYKIIIDGPNKDKVAGEMLMAMYDASLDQFVSHQWRRDFYPQYFGQINIEAGGFYPERAQALKWNNDSGHPIKSIKYPQLIPLDDFRMYSSRMRTAFGQESDVMLAKSMAAPSSEVLMDSNNNLSVSSTESDGTYSFDDEKIKIEDGENTLVKPEVSPRINLNETVFFFPQMSTDEAGRIVIKFKMNEALTRWRLMSLVHTEDFKVGYDERTVQTQKDIMIFPNAPRFIRDGDKITFSGKVTNMTNEPQDVEVKLQLWNTITMQDISKEMIKSDISYNVKVEGGQSTGVYWVMEIPERYVDVLTYRMSAETSSHTDAEENSMPVLTDRMLVTESMPLWIKGNSNKLFHFNAFKNNLSTTKKDYKYTFEYTAHPVWYAIQALPYMNEDRNSTSIGLTERLYANVLASKIAIAHPKIKAVFDQWAQKDKEALMSNLSKNQELKNAILDETPWVRQALSEAEQKRNIALLFDLTKMSAEKDDILSQLNMRQLSNGGFSWLANGRDNVYVTQNIMETIGHLYQLEALGLDDVAVQDITRGALRYMDDELIRRYNKLKESIRTHGGNMNNDHLDELSIMYLYVRSFFKHIQPSKHTQEAVNYYLDQCEKYWLPRSLSGQAMIGFVLKRNTSKVANDIYNSLYEKAIQNEEMGMYWNEGNGYFWYQLPIERHALILEFFAEMSAPSEQLDALKVWLLKNKQTTQWKTSKATASAIYALLIQVESKGISKWVVESIQPVITVGNELINTSTRDSESGTGYIKKSWSGTELSKDMGVIKVTNNNSSIAWGAAYYQYFEKLDKITSFKDTPLKITKTTYKIIQTKDGDKLVSLENSPLTPGDKLMVRIEIRVDRDMEYVLMKDMRAGGTEPINVLSQYKYNGGLSYYEATQDVATNFFFDYLRKGTYVFEYPLRVVHKGDFSMGITTIGSMYAPEFTSHSSGSRLLVK